MRALHIWIWLSCAGVGMAVAQTAVEHVIHTFGNFTKGANPYGTLVRDTSGNLYGTTYQGGAANLGLVFKMHAGGYQVLYSFKGGADGSNPYAGVMLDSVGNLYGTTYQGGTANAGVVYKVDPSGKETVLHSFTGGADGANPYAGVIVDLSGNLYGTTVNGGLAGAGVVYKLNPSGQETIVYSFKGKADGANPYGGLILDSSGSLYGTTLWGGSKGKGAIFRMDPSGQETVLHSFTAGNGGNPYAGVTRDPAGNLYGTATTVIYKVDTSGQFTILYRFALGVGPQNPRSGLALDATGNLYGTTDGGGAASAGVVFRLDTAGDFKVLYAFPGGPLYQVPTGGVILDPAGQVFGTTPNAGLVGMVYRLAPSGQETTLYTFPGAAGGTRPFGGVIRDSAGNLYGSTTNGGTANKGVLYQVDAAGKEKLLRTFSDFVGDIVARDAAGNLYGSAGNTATGLGSIFKLDVLGNYTVLYNFAGGADGTGSDGVILDSAGNLYGAGGGGTAPAGLIFKLSTSGQFNVLFTFSGGVDGSDPNPDLTVDSAGNIYGTTAYGGLGGGVVFKVAPNGRQTVLYTFTGGLDGSNPLAGVTLDAAGNLYGTTSNGIPNGGRVYELAPSGQYLVLYAFTSPSGGDLPFAGVVRDASGNLYGTTNSGGGTGCGGNGCGVVYKLGPDGQETVLHSFTGGINLAGPDGGKPEAGVILDPAGNLYGTCPFGGVAGGGVVYEIKIK